jgi:serine protease inhibitor
MMAKSATGRQRPPKDFRAGHPFLIFLRDKALGMILFTGRVAEP